MKVKLCLLWCLLPLIASAAIYKSVDKHGNITFSDQPQQNSRQFQIGPAQGFDSPPQKQNISAAKNTDVKKSSAVQHSYSSLKISSPENNAIFYMGRDSIDVSAMVTPSLQAGDEAVLQVDGQAVSTIAGPTENLKLRLTTITAGKHSMVVEIRSQGSNGKALKTSNRITYYVLVHHHKPVIKP